MAAKNLCPICGREVKGCLEDPKTYARHINTCRIKMEIRRNRNKARAHKRGAECQRRMAT